MEDRLQGKGRDKKFVVDLWMVYIVRWTKMFWIDALQQGIGTG